MCFAFFKDIPLRALCLSPHDLYFTVINCSNFRRIATVEETGTVVPEQKYFFRAHLIEPPDVAKYMLYK